MHLLIPAYEPDHRLVELVRDLSDRHVAAGILVVDDGSGPAFTEIFDAVVALGARVLRHRRNTGKAEALRSGFAWVQRRAPHHDVICADSDGQHRPDDILAVAAHLAALPDNDTMVLGVRRFVGDVPLRSRVGNRTTSALVAMSGAGRISDTQTGLRGYPAAMLPWLLSVPGERFAWELAVLLAAPRAGLRIEEVEIATVYLDQNASSHFRPVVDSLKVLWPLVKFASSSLLAFAVDVALLMLLVALGLPLLPAVVGARVVSAGLNFLVNRHLVFSADRGPRRQQLLRYTALAVILVGLSYAGLALFTAVGVALGLAKVVTDLGLWLLSFRLQQSVVFAGHRPTAVVAPEPVGHRR